MEKHRQRSARPHRDRGEVPVLAPRHQHLRLHSYSRLRPEHAPDSEPDRRRVAGRARVAPAGEGGARGRGAGEIAGGSQKVPHQARRGHGRRRGHLRRRSSQQRTGSHDRGALRNSFFYASSIGCSTLGFHLSVRFILVSRRIALELSALSVDAHLNEIGDFRMCDLQVAWTKPNGATERTEWTKNAISDTASRFLSFSCREARFDRLFDKLSWVRSSF